MGEPTITIAELRAKNGKMSQTELAKRLNVAQSTVAGWEQNIESIRGTHLVRLCHEFKVKASDILGA